MRIAAAILAGGKSRRLGGTAKGLLSVAGGLPMLQRLIHELAAAEIDDIIVVANDPRPYAAFGKPIIGDLRQGNGPLGGIEAALHHWAPRHDRVLFVPCDLPNFSSREMMALKAAHRLAPDRITVAATEAKTVAEPEAARPHPLCAVVPVRFLPDVEKAIAAGDYGVGRLWQALGADLVYIDEPARLFNVNTPDDLARWRQTAWRKQSGNRAPLAEETFGER
jgi:molybdopterin-guanine dinucleotide biosynthesis protein A